MRFAFAVMLTCVVCPCAKACVHVQASVPVFANVFVRAWHVCARILRTTHILQVLSAGAVSWDGGDVDMLALKWDGEDIAAIADGADAATAESGEGSALSIVPWIDKFRRDHSAASFCERLNDLALYDKTLSIWLVCTDNGPDVVMARKLMQGVSSRHPTTWVFDCDCLAHQFQLMVLRSLSAVDTSLSEWLKFGQTYYSSLSKIMHLWRDQVARGAKIEPVAGCATPPFVGLRTSLAHRAVALWGGGPPMGGIFGHPIKGGLAIPACRCAVFRLAVSIRPSSKCSAPFMPRGAAPFHLGALQA